MKKLVLAVFALTLFSSSFAQDKKISLGVKAGLNIASLTNLGSGSSSFGGSSVSSNHSPKLLPNVGLYSEFKISDLVSFQPELLFSMKGYRYKSTSKVGSNSSEYNESLALSYLDIPLQLRLNIKGFHILAGPYIGILLSSTYKTKSEVTTGNNKVTTEKKDTSKDGLKTVDAGVYLGAGYQLESGLNFGAKWCRGFADVFENANNHQNNVFQFYVGYAF